MISLKRKNAKRGKKAQIVLGEKQKTLAFHKKMRERNKMKKKIKITPEMVDNRE